MDKKNNFNRFLVLWAGQLISQVGSGMTIFGLTVYVFFQTGQTSDIALITMAAFLPVFLLTPFSGVLVDRYDRRRMMMLGDSLSVVGLVFMLFVLRGGVLEAWQICIGLSINSVFSSLVEPAYRASVSDLLTRELYTKASGMVQLASASKFLIAPFLAGLLMTYTSIEFIMMIDGATFVVTAITSRYVEKNMHKSPSHKNLYSMSTIVGDMKEGWLAIYEKKGVFILVTLGMVLTFSIGFMQVLAGPMILNFADEKTLGLSQSIMACGMLGSSIIVSSRGFKKKYTQVLCSSIAGLGLGMILFGSKASIIWVTVWGVFIFSCLPFVNACLDYLIRINIESSVQGRVWGIIGLLSQLGYRIAYIFLGVLADTYFEPLMSKRYGELFLIQELIGVGRGRGIALMIIIAGCLLISLAMVMNRQSSIHKLERGA